MYTRSPIHLPVLLALAAALCCSGSCLAQSGGPYTVTWSSIDGGGITTAATGGPYTVAGTIGQPDAGRAAGVPYDCLSGYWGAAGRCPADFNGSGTITVQDIFDFLAAWFAGLPTANFNGVSGITVQDIFDFLAAWFAGCN